MEKILIVGSSEHSRVIIDLIEQEKKYNIAGLIDPKRTIGELVSSYPVLGRREGIQTIIQEHKITGVVIAVGDNWNRNLEAQKIKNLAPQLKFVSPVHPFSSIGKNVTIGEGTVIMAGTCINTGSRIGDFCIINTKVSLDHDCVVSNFSSLAPGVTTGGMVNIGEFTAVSIGANILHGIKIGSHSVIGAGSMVNKNIEDEVVAYGVPAKVIRGRGKGDKYL